MKPRPSKYNFNRRFGNFQEIGQDKTDKLTDVVFASFRIVLHQLPVGDHAFKDFFSQSTILPTLPASQ